MLEDIIQRKDVSLFMEEIQNNERYFQKTSKNLFDHSFYVSKELALFIFYESLFQYRLLFEDDYLLEEFLDQLRKIYKKFDCFEDIREGVHKILCKLLCYQLNISDIHQKEAREKLISYVYNRYVLNGYYIHGFQCSYSPFIGENGFVPEIYENYYSRFMKARDILEKYHIKGVLTKNFRQSKVYFTGDFVMGCYYSLYAPMYFYKFILNCDFFGKRIRKDFYLKDNLSLVISHLKRFMSSRIVKESDQNFILDLVTDEWNLIHREKRNISLLLVKKRMFSAPVKELSDYLDDSRNIYELIDALLNSKNNNIEYMDALRPEQFEIVSLPFPYLQNTNEEEEKLEEEYNQKEQEVGLDFLNVYGNVSVLLLLGSVFVTIGVIISIFMVLRG